MGKFAVEYKLNGKKHVQFARAAVPKHATLVKLCGKKVRNGDKIVCENVDEGNLLIYTHKRGTKVPSGYAPLWLIRKGNIVTGIEGLYNNDDEIYAFCYELINN